MEHFEVDQISKIGGEVAEQWGELMEDLLVERLVKRQNEKLVSKLNRSIEKERDDLKLSLSVWFENGAAMVPAERSASCDTDVLSRPLLDRLSAPIAVFWIAVFWIAVSWIAVSFGNQAHLKHWPTEPGSLLPYPDQSLRQQVRLPASMNQLSRSIITPPLSLRSRYRDKVRVHQRTVAE